MGKRSTAGKGLSAMHINDSGQEYIVYVVMPGMQRTDFSVAIEDHLLTISAAKKEALHCYSDTNENNAVWKQTFNLPMNADTLLTAAEYKNGELQIHFPKRENAVHESVAKVFVY
jgi:HSP20 family protein